MIAIGRNVTGVTLGLLGLGSFTFLALGLVFLKLSPLVVGVLLLGGATIAVSAFRPYVGVHVMLALVYFEGVVQVTEGVTFTKFIGGLITAGWLASALMQRRLRDVFNVPTALVVAFLAWCVVAWARALDPSVALKQLFSYVLLGLSMMMIGGVVDTPQRLNRLIFAFALWTTLSSVIALFMYYTGMTLVANGLVGNRNLLAWYINVGAIAALLVYLQLRSVVSRLLIAIAIPVLLLTLALTLSRTGLIVMMVTILTVWYRLARERGFLLLLGSTLACVTLVFILPGQFWNRASTILPSIERQEDTFGMRIHLWEAGFRLVQDRPLTGVGPGNFMMASSRYAGGQETEMRLNSHNAYVGVAAEAGIPGLALFVAIILSAMGGTRRAVRIARQAGRGDLALSGMTVETMMLATVLTGITMNVEGLKVLWIGLGLCVAFNAIVRRSATVEARPEVPVLEIAGSEVEVT